jgi:TetR/AcrR family transcriptional repressor of nem operon
VQGHPLKGWLGDAAAQCRAENVSTKARSAWNVIYSNTFRPLGKGKSWRPVATLLENPLAQNGTDRFNGQQIDLRTKRRSSISQGRPPGSKNKLLDTLNRPVYVKTMKRIHSKDDIVQVGLDLVLSRGFSATGVEAILKQANVPKGSFYNFFPSKEDFALAIIDKYVADRVELFHPIFSDESLPPLERIKKSFVTLFEGNDCTKGCLIGNLSLEMSNQFDNVRQRLDLAFQNWAKLLTRILLQAQKEKTIPPDMDVEMLAENLISSFEGALLHSKVKKSSEPLNNFIHLYFDIFLAKREVI